MPPGTTTVLRETSGGEGLWRPSGDKPRAVGLAGLELSDCHVQTEQSRAAHVMGFDSSDSFVVGLNDDLVRPRRTIEIVPGLNACN